MRRVFRALLPHPIRSSERIFLTVNALVPGTSAIVKERILTISTEPGSRSIGAFQRRHAEVIGQVGLHRQLHRCRRPKYRAGEGA